MAKNVGRAEKPKGGPGGRSRLGGRAPARRRAQKSRHYDWQYKWAHRLAAMNRFQHQIGRGQQPREQRQRPVKVVIRHGMNQPRPCKQRQVVKPQRNQQASGRTDTSDTRWLAQIPDIERKARRIKEKRCQNVGARHWNKFTPGRFSLCLSPLCVLCDLCVKSLFSWSLKNAEKPATIEKTCYLPPVTCNL